MPVAVLHCHDDARAPGVRHQVHGAAEALDAARQHPVGQVAARRHLQGAEQGEVEAARADHAEGLVRAEDAGARRERDRFLARVDEVRVLGARRRVGAQPQDAVLRLQLDLDGGGDEGGGQHGHADAEVGVHAVGELAGGAADDAGAFGGRGAGAEHGHRCRCCCGAFGVRGAGVGDLLDAVGRGALDDALDVDAREVHGGGVEGADGDDVFGLDDGARRVAAHGAVEVRRREPELAVAQAVGLPGLDEGVVAADGLLHEVGLAGEDLDVAGGAVLRDAAVAVEAERELPRLHDGADRGGRVEGGDAGAAGATALGERALRGELQLDVAGEVHLLQGFVFADVAGDHLLDLLGGEEEAEAGAVDAGVVGDGREAGDGGGGVDGVDEGVGDAGEAEAAGEEGAVGAHVGDGLGGGGEDFVDGIAGAGGGEKAGGGALGDG